MPSGWAGPVPARPVFLAGADQRITDAITWHVQAERDQGDDDNDGPAGALVPGRRIADQFHGRRKQPGPTRPKLGLPS